MDKANKYVRDVLSDMGANPIHNYISPGLISTVLTNGKVRMFRNTRPQEQFITPHSHRFNFAALVVAGSVTNTIYGRMHQGLRSWGGEGPKDYRYMVSHLDYKGQCGEYEKRQHAVENFWLSVAKYNANEWYYMDYKEIHSIEFSHDAQVILFEGPNVTNTTTILEPFVDSGTVNTFKVEPWMFKQTPQDDHLK